MFNDTFSQEVAESEFSQLNRGRDQSAEGKIIDEYAERGIDRYVVILNN
jgi:hypothetical protein